MKSSFEKLKRPKNQIGWVHGILACIGGIILSFLFMAFITSILPFDYALNIIPSMIITPILVSIVGIWILFSKNLLEVIKKIIYTSIVLIFIFILKGFVL